MARLALVFVLLALDAAAAPAPSRIAEPASAKPAETKPPETKPADTKPTAHFASLRSDKVNLRTGPGPDYPIEWVFVRRGLPVEILAQFDTWRKIRDAEGTVGWVHQGMLSSQRSILVTGTIRVLRHDPKPDGEIVASLEPGVVARISRCDPAWCEVKVRGYRGWLERNAVWGVEADEIIE